MEKNDGEGVGYYHCLVEKIRLITEIFLFHDYHGGANHSWFVAGFQNQQFSLMNHNLPQCNCPNEVF